MKVYSQVRDERDKFDERRKTRVEMQEVAEAIGAFPGDSEEFAVLETTQVFRILGCQVLGGWRNRISGMLCAEMVDTGDTEMLEMLKS